MSYNIADLFEHIVDTVPDRVALIVGDEPAAPTPSSRSGPTGSPTTSPPGASGPATTSASTRQNSHEWVETMFGGLQAPGGADQHQLPLRRGRAALPVRQRRPGRARATTASTPPGSPRSADRTPMLQHFVMIDDGTGADVAGDRVGRYDEARAPALARARDFAERSADDLYILYTGGTTGMPKGVMWRQEDVFFALGGGIDAVTGETVADE